MRFIFIISAGRSGSTVLQSLLNSNSNILIRGENNNFFYETFTTYQSLHKQNNSDERDNPWFGFEHFEPTLYKKMIRKLGKRYLLGDYSKQSIDTLGFKEIRLFNLFDSQGVYGKKNTLLKQGTNPKAELLAYTNYIKELFPDSTTIFLRRNPSEIANSGWWKNRETYNLQTLCKDLDSFQNEFANIATPGDDLCLDYQMLQPQNLASIRKKIYEPLKLKFNQEIAKKVLEKKLDHGQWKNLKT